MKKISHDRYKRYTQIFHLKEILNNVNNESNKLISTITELQKIFKSTKKIIKEEINELAKIKTGKAVLNEDLIKQQICTKIKKLIQKYKERSLIQTVNNKKEEYRKLLREKTNNFRLILKDLNYKQLQSEKDILIQIIKEKKSICNTLKNLIKNEKEFSSMFKPVNLTFFDNIYDWNNELLKMNSKKKKVKEILEIQNNNAEHLKVNGTKIKNDLENNKINYIKKLHKYIKEKDFDCSLTNNRHKEEYNLQMELISEYGYSSDSDSDTEQEDFNSNNKDINNNDLKPIIKNKREKKMLSLPLSEKDTCDHDKEKEAKNNDTIMLTNKLVELKEKYNQLMNERIEIDCYKNSIQEKISNIKSSFVKNIYKTELATFKLCLPNIDIKAKSLC
jgi:hypothetical protein